MDDANNELTDSQPIESSTDMFGGQISAEGESNNYKVLARKYRPQNFDDLCGQDAMVQTLSNAFETGRIAQAWMLTGVRGVGKTTTARILARALNYELPGKIDKPSIKLDENGSHCQAIMEGRHIDVIEMDAASHTGINDIREITDAARYSPATARYKVYIIDEVHMLSNAAFNGLLKTLEEPPEHVKFIFATTEIRKVPVTVLSRCQRFDLRRIDAEVLVKLMRRISDAESVDISDEALLIIARAGEGSARDSLSLLDQAISHGAGHIDAENVRSMLGLSDRSQVIDLFECVMNGNAADALESLNAQFKAGADPSIVVSDLAEFVHLVTRFKIVPGSSETSAISEAERKRGSELSKNLSVRALSRAWQILLKGIPEVQTAPNSLVAAEMVLVRLCYSASLPSPEETLNLIRKGEISPPATEAKPQSDSQKPASEVQKPAAAETSTETQAPQTEQTSSQPTAADSEQPTESASDSDPQTDSNTTISNESEKEDSAAEKSVEASSQVQPSEPATEDKNSEDNENKIEPDSSDSQQEKTDTSESNESEKEVRVAEKSVEASSPAQSSEPATEVKDPVENENKIEPDTSDSQQEKTDTSESNQSEKEVRVAEKSVEASSPAQSSEPATEVKDPVENENKIEPDASDSQQEKTDTSESNESEKEDSAAEKSEDAPSPVQPSEQEPDDKPPVANDSNNESVASDSQEEKTDTSESNGESPSVDTPAQPASEIQSNNGENRQDSGSNDSGEEAGESENSESTPPSTPPDEHPAVQESPDVKDTNATNSPAEQETDQLLVLTSLDDVADLVKKKRELKLKVILEAHVRPVSFEHGRIEVQITEMAPVDFAKDLGQKLTDWTGERWTVVASDQEGGPTIKETRELEQQTKIDEAKKNPAVAEILKTWPGAEIININTQEPIEETIAPLPEEEEDMEEVLL